MSGSNALAAAKRRRVGGIEPNKPTPRGAVAGQIQRGNIIQTNQRTVGRPPLQQGRQPVPQYQNQQGRAIPNPVQHQAPIRGNQPVQHMQPIQNVKMSINNNFTDTDIDNDDAKSRDYSELPESSRFFMIPPLTDKPISHLQLLTVIYQYFNKLAYHLPNAVDTLGTNFNLLSSNCDNLNDRLEALETLPAETRDGSSNDTNNNQFQTIKEEFVNIRSEINAMKEQFKREINELKESFSSVTGSLRGEIDGIRQIVNDNLNQYVVEDETNANNDNDNDIDNDNTDINNDEVISTDLTEIN